MLLRGTLAFHSSIATLLSSREKCLEGAMFSASIFKLN
jgi:hypothetical protein